MQGEDGGARRPSALDAELAVLADLVARVEAMADEFAREVTTRRGGIRPPAPVVVPPEADEAA